MAKQEAGAGYRGRRRLPKLPSRRYSAVIASAFLGAIVILMLAASMTPASATITVPYDNPAVSLVGSMDRLNATDMASRSKGRGPAISNGQPAPVVWLLPLQCPYIITTYFTMRWGVMHWGVDLACGRGTPILAAANGTVTLSQFWDDYGNAIVIDHGGGIQTVYGHASALKAHVGDKVKAGDVVSYVGSTGDSTGNHLHFEVHEDGRKIDPVPFMKAHGVDLQKKLEAASGATVVGS